MRMEDFVRIVAFLILSIILLNFCAFGKNESDNIELRIVTKSGNTIVPGETLVAQLVKDDNTQILSDNVIWYTSEDGENFSEEEHVGKEYIVTWENAMKLKFIKATVNYQEVTYESVVQVDEVPSDILTGKGRRGSDSGWDIPANALENSPKENMFTVGNQDFVLLDTFHNEQSTFYVIAKGLYGQKAFSTVNTNRFDPDNENNIAYFLNNDFLKDGNSGKKLPEDIIKYINMDHVWITEPGGSEGDAKDAYTVRAGVTLMADWEFCKYADRFGLIDGNYVAGQTTVYWFRTAFGLEKRGDMMMEYRMAYKNFYTKASTGVSNIRPQFMLSKEFFKNVKPTNIGSNVVKAMMKVYNLDELVETGLYSEDELLKLGFKKINMSSKLSVPGQPSNILENIGGVYDLQANIYLDNTVNTDLDVSVIVCLYDENESLVNSSFINVTVPHHSRNNAYTIPIQNTDGRAITFRTFIYDGHLSNKYLKTDEQLGENTASVVFDTNNSILEIEGKTFINGTVRILIFSPAAYAESDWTDDVNSGIIYYLSELVADKNGAFTATISMAEEKGKYCVLINFPHQSGWKSYEFFYADITDYQNLVSDMNSAADADDVEAVIKHPLYSQILNLSLPMYDKLSPQDKEKIDFQNIYSIMAEKDTYLKPYTSQLLDKYNMRGFSVQWERVMYPEYIDKQVDALSKAGIKYARSSSSWAGFESGSNKTINYARSAMWMPKLYANGISHILMLSYNNTLYADKIMSGIVSKDNTIAYGDYAKAMLEKYPHIKTVEIWNEPDMNGFWIGNTPGENYTDYTDLLKYTSTELNKYRNDINIIGGVIAQTWTTDMLSGMLQNGAYGYMDSVSVHGYNYPNRIDEEFFEKRFVTHKNLLSEYGGWKRLIITEIGAPTGTGQSSVSEKDQARDVIMSYLLTDKFGLDGCMVYVLTNPGIKENDREAMFGVLRNTFEPKPAYIAVNQMNSALGGALYIGDIMLGEHVTAGVYHNNGVPLMVVWNKTKNNVETIAVPEDIVEIKDLLGKNVTVKDNITVGSEVYYLYDVKREYLSKAALNSVTHINQNLGEYKIHFGNYDLLDKEGILSALRLIADTAENLIQSVKNGIVDMEQARLSQILFEYHNMMKIFVNLYSAVANDTSLTEVSDYYSMAKEFIDDRKSQEQTDSLMYSEAMLKYAKQYYDNANDLLNSHENGEIKNSVINIWNYAGDIISKWAYDFCQLESGNNLKVYLKVPGENLKFYEEATQSLPVYIVNNGCNDFTGEVQLLDDKGNIVAKSMRVHSYSNQWKQINVDFDENNVPESGLYTLCFVDGSNKVITQKNLKINVVKSISVELLPSDNTIDKLDHINVKVNNLSNKTLTGNVSIIPPSGWSLSNSQITYTVAGNSSEIYSFKVNQKTAYAYNHYVFDIAVTNLQGKQILNVESPLSFTCIIAAQQPIDVYAFDGNIEEWSDAYPIYIQPVSKPNDIDLWTKSELSGRAFIKWDKDNLYVMCDVYDEFFAQTESEGRIWNGDSIQVAIDAQNDKANKYMPDDLEIGLALTDYGVQTYVWHGVNDDAVGSRSPSYGNVVRSNEKSITRYCMRIPKEELGLKEFTENMQIGFNLVINDSDLNTREGYAEFTAGTASGKNPSLWYTFNLCRPETNVIRLDMTVFPKSF